MKKILSLVLCVIMIFSAVSVVPTVSADTISDCYSLYWRYNDMYRKSEIEKVGDWYFGVKRAGDRATMVSVFGYDGDDTDITIPTEFEGVAIKSIHYFCFFSDSVKTLRIPKGITAIRCSIGYDEYLYSPEFPLLSENLKEIIVDTENEDYKSIDGVLFSKDGKELLLYPPAKTNRAYTVPKSVEIISDGAFRTQLHLESLTITENVRKIGARAFPEDYLPNADTYLKKLYFKNAILKETDINDEEDISYLPKVPGGTVYCVEGSPIYTGYKNLKYSNSYYDSLKTLPTAPDKLVKHADGKWYYYDDNYRSNAIGIIMHQKVWFYVENGVWTKKTDLVKYKGVWFYVKNGKWSTANNTLIKKNGKWFAVKDGKWYKGKSLISYKGYKFYVNNGFAQLGYNGKVKINGKTYTIKGGKVA